MSGVLSEEELKNLVWGDQPSRDYTLYAVTDIENECSAQEMADLTRLLDDMSALHERISWEISTTFLFLVSLFECYLLFRKSPTIYLTTLCLFYGYVFFLSIFTYKMTAMDIG